MQKTLRLATLLIVALFVIGLTAVAAQGGFNPQDNIVDENVAVIVNGPGFAGTFTQGSHTITTDEDDPKSVQVQVGTVKSFTGFRTDVMDVIGNGAATVGIATRKGLFKFGATDGGIDMMDNGTNKLPEGYTIFANLGNNCLAVLIETGGGVAVKPMKMAFASDLVLIPADDCVLTEAARAAAVQLMAYRQGFQFDLNLVALPTPEPEATETPANP